jgi:ketosteroid isomerase-like protein
MAGDPYVRAAALRLAPELDPAAVGAAVTTKLCGHWEHDGACRWPHHNTIAPTGDAHALRVVFVAPAEDLDEVETRIDTALRATDGVTVVVVARDVLRSDERALGQRLARGPADR